MFAEQVNKYSNAEVTWVQEEHMNQGCWNYLRPRMHAALKDAGIKKNEIEYVGRAPSSSPATGYGDMHETELEAFLSEAFL